MPGIEVRPFRRSDREQLTDLVNAHAGAVIPRMSVSVSTVLAQLEREPGEFIVDPWVSERATLVAEQRGRVAAAAHLLRYFADERAGESYRDSGEIRWFLFWPEAPAGNPYWPDATQAAETLIAACIQQLEDWGVSRQNAGGELPVPGVYGVPGQWPHIRAIYERAGFTHPACGRTMRLLPRPGRGPQNAQHGRSQSFAQFLVGQVDQIGQALRDEEHGVECEPLGAGRLIAEEQGEGPPAWRQ
jgi:hypothetical protein